jgi:hypothetical protein
MLQSSPSFIVLCRNLYWEGLTPFSFDMWDNLHFIELQAIAKKLSLRDLYGFFLEHQYYINLYAAIFILDIFTLSVDEKLTGLNNNISLVKECFDIIERHSEGFNPMQLDNYNHWSKKIKSYYDIS